MKVSIITVVWNNKDTIEDAIESVLGQTYKNIEYIIIDGGSTDGTVDLIKKYEDKIAYWVSEPDKGIYDAMNKGLKVATGEYISILNADDYYEEDAISLSLETILKTNSDYSYANARMLGEKSSVVIKPINPLDEQIYFQMPYPHVSLLIKSSIYREFGFYDTTYKIAGDHDFAVKVYTKGYRGIYIDKVICNLHEGGISSTFDANLEFFKVARKYKNSLSCYYQLCKQYIKYKAVKVLPSNISRFLMKMKHSRHV